MWLSHKTVTNFQWRSILITLTDDCKVKGKQDLKFLLVITFPQLMNSTATSLKKKYTNCPKSYADTKLGSEKKCNSLILLCPVFTVHMSKPWVLSYPLSAQQKLWSDWVDAHADLSLRWVHMSFCWLCHALAQMFNDKFVRTQQILQK